MNAVIGKSTTIRNHAAATMIKNILIPIGTHDFDKNAVTFETKAI